MTIEDEQLDELLRAVKSPDGMSKRLSQIPNIESSPDHRILRNRKWLSATIGVAMTIAALVLLFLYVQPSEIAEHSTSDDQSDREIERLLSEVRDELNTIALLRKVRELENTTRSNPKPRPVLNLEESVAMAMSISWKSSLDHGGSIDNVRPELEYVINSFPGTRGARDAIEILQVKQF